MKYKIYYVDTIEIHINSTSFKWFLLEGLNIIICLIKGKFHQWLNSFAVVIIENRDFKKVLNT